MPKFHLGLICVLIISTAGLTGCGYNASTMASATETHALQLGGSVYGGSTPITGASVQLWAAGAGGTDTAPTPIALSQPTTTKSDGTFSFSGTFTCPTTSDPQVYVVSRGGNAGGGNNPAIALMTALSDCNSLSSSTHILLNEATTAVAVNALNNYMDLSGDIGVNSNNPNADSMNFQFSFASVYIDPANGTVPGPLDNGTFTTVSPTYIPVLNTLANLLATCVDSPVVNGTSSLCNQIFQNAKTFSYNESLLDGDTLAPGYVPTDTIQLAMIMSSGYEAGGTTASQAQFQLLPAQPPFQPASSSAPAPAWGFLPGGVVMAAVTLTNDGIVHMQPGVQTAFSVAVNTEGAFTSTSDVTLSLNVPASLGNTFDVFWTICQTNPSTGQCLAAPNSYGYGSATPGSTITFSVIIGTSAAIPTTTVPIVLTGPDNNAIGSTTVVLSTN